MKWFRNRNTATKLIMAFGGLAVLAALVGYQGIRGMGTVDDLLKLNYEKHALGIDNVQEANLQLLKLSRGVSNVVIDGVFNDQKALEGRIANRKRYQDAFAKALAAFKTRLVLDAQRTRVAEIEKVFKELSEKEMRVIELAQHNKLKEAHAALGELRQVANHIEEVIEKAVEGKREVMRQAAEEADATYRSTRLFVIGMIVVAVALAMGIGIVIARLIARPLAAAVDVLDTVAKGDFTRKLEVDTTDEVGRMAVALNQAVDSMRTALQEVNVAADHAASASQQLSAAAEQLSSGAQEQASALEETAASLEEITGTVKQNADNARQASQLAVGSRDVAEKGGQVVREAVTSMTEINKSSKKIADIITTIDEIAFQTNLLALNAAVEAARAGEQGRGFAVVAAEVRNLAQRSATAAKEIKDLIQDSVQKVETGSELVNRSGETLTEIVGSVKRVTDIIAEIAAASQEQTTGIDQVNRAVTQMDQVTQANAAQTEELSSTAQSLAAQAEQLQALVARFKLGEAPAPARKAAPAAAPRSTTPAPIAKFVAKAKTTREELVLAGARPDHRPASRNGSAHAEDDGFEEF